MENVVTEFGGAYSGRRVLLTGHTGFKGSWLALWLQALGAEVHGIALPPETSPSHWELLGLDMDSRYLEIRDPHAVRDAVADIRPEVVLHLAAQPLVRRSYRSPLQTWETNVMGTAHVLEACRQAGGVAALVVVTTDKCYENREWVWGYRETDPLGGYDPYSASKAGAELVAASYRRAFFSAPEAPLLATARAGNVIGGGDWSEDRLIPDLMRAIASGQPLAIRSPEATRPWQHVLECLAGYLALGQRLLAGDSSCAEAWNFGPGPEGNFAVRDVLEALRRSWPQLSWVCHDQPRPHEATLLQLECSKARFHLGWQPAWSFEEGLAATAEWYRSWLERGQVISRVQLARYVSSARDKRVPWADCGGP